MASATPLVNVNSTHALILKQHALTDGETNVAFATPLVHVSSSKHLHRQATHLNGEATVGSATSLAHVNNVRTEMAEKSVASATPLVHGNSVRSNIP